MHLNSVLEACSTVLTSDMSRSCSRWEMRVYGVIFFFRYSGKLWLYHPPSYLSKFQISVSGIYQKFTTTTLWIPLCKEQNFHVPQSLSFWGWYPSVLVMNSFHPMKTNLTAMPIEWSHSVLASNAIKQV